MDNAQMHPNGESGTAQPVTAAAVVKDVTGQTTFAERVHGRTEPFRQTHDPQLLAIAGELESAPA
jgi:hypothetical protein